jgi:uncharacterized protein YecE (DUF72 family)
MTLQPGFFDAAPFPCAGTLRFGTSSFSAPEWVGTFYPRGTRAADFLRYYATQFDTVEVDATYYHVPAPRTVDAWAKKTPEHFTLSAKFPRSVVHAGTGPEPDAERLLKQDSTYAERDAFLEVMGRLGRRCGPLILQFPHFPRGSFLAASEFYARLECFLADLPGGFSYAVEIRNRDWVTPEFAALCRRHRVALVLVDRIGMPHGDEIAATLDPMTAPFGVVRLLGDRQRIERITTRWEKEVIDQGPRLERWAALLLLLATRDRRIFVYANNHYAGHAPTTIRRLQELVRRRGDRS